MDKIKEYHIDSLEKLCNIINEDNFISLTTDLMLWLDFHVKMMKKIRHDLPKNKTKNKTNSQLSKSSFIWLDDGKNDLKFIRIKNSDTGEIIDYEIKEEGKKFNF